MELWKFENISWTFDPFGHLKMENVDICEFFQARESPAPLNKPTPTPQQAVSELFFDLVKRAIPKREIRNFGISRKDATILLRHLLIVYRQKAFAAWR